MNLIKYILLSLYFFYNICAFIYIKISTKDRCLDIDEWFGWYNQEIAVYDGPSIYGELLGLQEPSCDLHVYSSLNSLTIELLEIYREVSVSEWKIKWKAMTPGNILL